MTQQTERLLYRTAAMPWKVLEQRKCDISIPSYRGSAYGYVKHPQPQGRYSVHYSSKLPLNPELEEHWNGFSQPYVVARPLLEPQKSDSSFYLKSAPTLSAYIVEAHKTGTKDWTKTTSAPSRNSSTRVSHACSSSEQFIIWWILIMIQAFIAFRRSEAGKLSRKCYSAETSAWSCKPGFLWNRTTDHPCESPNTDPQQFNGQTSRSLIGFPAQ